MAISHTGHQCRFMEQCKWLSLTQGTSAALWTSASGYPSDSTLQCGYRTSAYLRQSTSVASWTSASSYLSDRAPMRFHGPVQVAISHIGHQCGYRNRCMCYMAVLYRSAIWHQCGFMDQCKYLSLRRGRRCGFMHQYKCLSLRLGTSVASWTCANGYIFQTGHKCGFTHQCK